VPGAVFQGEVLPEVGAPALLPGQGRPGEEAHEEEEASRLEPVPAGLFHLLQGHGLRPAEEGEEGLAASSL